MIKEVTKQRFWEKVEIIPDHSCWEWAGGIGRDGYGKFKLHGRQYGAHRASYELHNGLIPKGMHVCHKCDRKTCVRPEHLFLGTHSDNMRDKTIKGGQFMKLNQDEVDEIKKIYAQGNLSQAYLARKYKVDPSTISKYINNRYSKRRY